MPASDIPFGSEFSPSVIDLPRLLTMVESHGGDRFVLQDDIDRAFFPHQRTDRSTRKTLADNTILSMQAYGLLQLSPDTYRLTKLGQDLLAIKHDSRQLYEVLARHVLLNGQGLLVIGCIQDLMAADEKLTKQTISDELRRRGYHVPTNGKHLNVVRQWLELAGVLNPRQVNSGSGMWEPNEERIRELVGVSVNELDELADLTPAQRDFARALAILDTDDVVSSDVRDYAISLYGTVFPEGGLPQSVLHRLQEVGLIEWTKTTSGRGAKPHRVSPTDRLRNKYLFPILDALGDAAAVESRYRRLLRVPLSEIWDQLDSEDTHSKGLALETLAFYLTRLLDLRFVGWRKRGRSTGGSEVDILVEGARLLFSRWQIQCKNTSGASVEDIAREVGIATAMRTNVVMLVCRGRIGPAARSFARSVMENTAMQIVLLEGRDLQMIRQNPASITRLLNQQAELAMRVKRSQVDDLEDDSKIQSWTELAAERSLVSP